LGCGFSYFPHSALVIGALALAKQASAASLEQTSADSTSFRWSFVRLSGAESCPGAERIAAGVRSRLGRDPFADDAERNIEGSVTRDGQIWRAHLSVLDADGQVLGSRDLQSSEPDCNTLADAVTLAVALVIDPRAAFAPLTPAPARLIAPQAAPPASAPALVETPARASAPASAPAPRSSPASAPAGSPLAVALRGSVALGLLPRPAFGVESAGEVGLTRRWGLSAGVSYFPEARTSDGGFSFGLSAAFVGLCVGALQSRALRAAICGEAQLGAMHAVVYSVRALPPGDHLWAGARVGTRLRVLLDGPLWLEAGGMAVAPLLRHEFALKGQQDPVFESSVLSFAATLGLSASIH
jgi:hypothetical protein